MKKTMRKIILTMLLAVGITACFCPEKACAASVPKAQNAVRAYNKYVTAKRYKKYTRTTKNMYFLTDPVNTKLYNSLPDLNHDGVPELVLQNEKSNTFYVFTYRQNKVKYVRKITTKYKSDYLPATLMYHMSKKQIWTMEMDLSKLEKALIEIMSEDESMEKVNANEIIKKLIDAVDVGIRESVYKVSSSGQKITKVRSSELRIQTDHNGILIKMNGKERLRCAIYINDKTFAELDFDDENMKFDSVRIEFGLPGSQDVLSCVANLGGYTAEQIMDLDLEKLEKKMTLKYYYGQKELSEKDAEKKLKGMLNFITSMKSLSDDTKSSSFIACNLTKDEIGTYLMPRPEKMRMSYSWIRLRIGQSSKPVVKYVTPADASGKVVLISNNEKIAKITQSGRIKAVKSGKTIVTATSVLNPKIELKIRVIVHK